VKKVALPSVRPMILALTLLWGAVLALPALPLAWDATYTGETLLPRCKSDVQLGEVEEARERPPGISDEFWMPAEVGYCRGLVWGVEHEAHRRGVRGEGQGACFPS
jgi:hypothetical protein